MHVLMMSGMSCAERSYTAAATSLATLSICMLLVTDQGIVSAMSLRAA